MPGNPLRSRSLTLRSEGRTRVVIEGVDPEVDAGKFPAKGVAGDRFTVECDAYADGHDHLRCVLLWRQAAKKRWSEVEMEPLGNDRWRGVFVPPEPGRCVYTTEAWIDPFGSWLNDLGKRVAAGQDISVDREIGARLIEERVHGVKGGGAETLAGVVERLRDPHDDDHALLAALDSVRAVMNSLDPRKFSTRYERALEVEVDRERAAFSAWYELFPRSTGANGAHGTFTTAAAMLPYVAELGFDIVYLPPIHPIGHTARKGKNNAVKAAPGDVGSPWAIGGHAGGHTAIEPALGTLDDFRHFRESAEALEIEVALDIAFQCSPDHPWVTEHPSWFKHRPDGSVQYAENPPKKYQDIYPLNFESDDWKGLWNGLRDVFLFWMKEGVRVFRVDNPHTKAFPFWEWCIPELKKVDPGLIFLSEAFTRPRPMYRLAQLGFTQSYTYFTWRTSAWEMRRYVEELTSWPVKNFFRPNFWPNTPDILHETLQKGGRSAFMLRALLAATLTGNWGIYGPAFELLEHVPREPGSEEYRDSEKYEIKKWDLERSDSLGPVLTRLNAIRRAHPALQRDRPLTFHNTDNDRLLCYSKRGDQTGSDDTIIVVVNFNTASREAGWIDLDAKALGLEADGEFEVKDLFAGGCFKWRPGRNYVELDPAVTAGHVLEVRRA